MEGCSLEKLTLLLDKKLNLDTRLGIFDHLDRCCYCKDAVYRIARDRDRAASILRPFRGENQSVA